MIATISLDFFFELKNFLVGVICWGKQLSGVSQTTWQINFASITHCKHDDSKRIEESQSCDHTKFIFFSYIEALPRITHCFWMTNSKMVLWISKKRSIILSDVFSSKNFKNLFFFSKLCFCCISTIFYYLIWLIYEIVSSPKVCGVLQAAKEFWIIFSLRQRKALATFTTDLLPSKRYVSAPKRSIFLIQTFGYL